MDIDVNQKFSWLNAIHTKEQQLFSAASQADEIRNRKIIAKEWMKGIEECSRQAVLALLEVLALCPDDVESLNSLMRLFEESAMWTEAVEALKKLVEVNTQPETRNKCLVTLGDIYHTHLNDSAHAVRAYRHAFTEGNCSLELFTKLVSLLIAEKAWKDLEKVCLRMMAVLEQTEEVNEEQEIRKLLINTVHVHLNQSCATASVLANEKYIHMQDLEQLQHVAKVCADNPQTYPQAIELYAHLTQKNPDDILYYQALAKLHKKMNARDKYWCVCAVLSFVDRASPEERDYYEQHRPTGAVRIKAPLSNELWAQHVIHPDESLHIGKILEALTASVRYLMVLPHKVFGVGDSQKRPPDDTLLFSKAFFYGAHVLGIPRLPELYIRETLPSGLSYAVTEPPSTVCGANLLSGYTLQELQFVVGHHLTYYRPEHYLRCALPAEDEIGPLLGAALQLGKPDYDWPSANGNTFDAKAVAEHVDALKGRISPSDMKRLNQAVDAFAISGDAPDIKKWIQMVELTACRVGLLLCNDLDTAIRMIQAVTVETDTAIIDRKIGALMSFCVSNSYHQLRKTMGISLETESSASQSAPAVAKD